MSPVAAGVAVGLVIVATLAIGSQGLRLSRTTSDFMVASRTVSPLWNASAIGGEYLSAASFLGVAGLITVYGADMLWYPVGYTAGYLVLLVLVAAPLRRSGAYTLPDFAESRLQSLPARRVAAVLVVLIGWLYLLPQMQAAGLVLATATGAPRWAGPVVVAVVVVVSVAAGGMRSLTFVQAFQYWLKLVAIAVPAVVLVAVWHAHGQPAPPSGAWAQPLSGTGGREHPLYWTYSLMLSLFLGTMGLPHVLVRYYTNPDGFAARRTTVLVLALVGAFYLFPTVYGALGRIYAADLGAGGRADAVVIELPVRMLPGAAGQGLAALLTAGAFAAFLSTSSGLTASVAGVLSQEVWRGGIRSFRLASVAAVAVPLVASAATVPLGAANLVGLAFAVAASSFCPLLVLGVWWPRLTDVGAIAGLVVGGGLAGAMATTTLVAGTRLHGWPAAVLAQPAAVTIPLAFLVMVAASLATARRRPAGAYASLRRLAIPESRDTLPSATRSAQPRPRQATPSDRSAAGPR